MSERFEYTISDDLVLEMFDKDNPNENNAPFLRQPHRADESGEPFQTREEVVEFAEAIIENLLNPPAPEPEPEEPALPAIE